MNELFTAVTSTIPAIQTDILTATTAVIGISIIIFGIAILAGLLSGSRDVKPWGGNDDGGKGAR